MGPSWTPWASLSSSPGLSARGVVIVVRSTTPIPAVPESFPRLLSRLLLGPLFLSLLPVSLSCRCLAPSFLPYPLPFAIPVMLLCVLGGPCLYPSLCPSLLASSLVRPVGLSRSSSRVGPFPRMSVVFLGIPGVAPLVCRSFFE